MTRPRVTDFSRSDELNARYHRIVPGGSHTYSKGEDQFPWAAPKFIERAKGAHCWDVDGNRYLDWAMGNRVICLGHAYPAVDDAVRLELDRGLNFTKPSVLEFELAEYLVDFLPVAEMVKFGKNGSDVTTAAVKLARAATGRKYVVYCSDHPFFSIHDWFIGATVMNAGTLGEESRFTLSFPYNDIETLAQICDEYDVAAVILEPVKLDEPRDNFLSRLRELTARRGIVLIFDEMISGIRFDLRGAHHRYGVYPDLAAYGKSISNGYSFSMLAGKRELMELGGLRHDGARTFLLSQTHGAESTGLAACRATLEEAQRVNLTDHIWALGKRLVDLTRSVVRDEGIGDHVHVIGFDCNPQFVCTRADGTYWPELHTSFHEELVACGILAPWISITYSHGEEELVWTEEALRSATKKIARALAADGVDESFAGDATQPVFRTFNRCRQSRCGQLHPEAPQLDCCRRCG